jgi:hypothetical protein
MARRTLENSIAAPQRSGVPPVAPVIPSSGWWTGNNQLGNEVAFAPDTNNRQTILKLEEWGPPEVWTVSLFLTHEIEAFNAFDVTAELDFGAGGATQIVQMDWVNGAQISVPMNAIDVIATFKNVDITTIGSGIRLGVQVGRGRRAGCAVPTLTMLDNVFLAANNVFPELVEIPAFAKHPRRADDHLLDRKRLLQPVLRGDLLRQRTGRAQRAGDQRESARGERWDRGAGGVEVHQDHEFDAG